MSDVPASFLEVRDLHVSYGAVPALRGVSLSVGAGESVAILGRNGVGKTTTLNAIAGVVEPDRGEVRLEGVDLGKLRPERRIRRGLVLVPEGRGIFPGLTVVENLRLGPYHLRRHRAARAGVEARAFDLFPELARCRDQRAGSLSGGEQQMLVTARAVLAEPHLLLLDEPSLGLSPIAVERLYEIFTRLRADGIALLIVEQYVHLALDFTDRAYVLDRGSVVMQGDSGELAASQEVVDAYLASVHDTEGAA